MLGSGMSAIPQADSMRRTAGNAAPLLDTRTFADTRRHTTEKRDTRTSVHVMLSAAKHLLLGEWPRVMRFFAQNDNKGRMIAKAVCHFLQERDTGNNFRATREN